MPADTTRRITLKYSPILRSWEVASVQNSALMVPGEWLNHDYLVALVKSGVWEVSQVPIDFKLPNIPIPLPIPALAALGKLGEKHPDIARLHTALTAAAEPPPPILAPPENVDQ